MARKSSSLMGSTLLKGAAIGAGLALFANHQFQKHPEFFPSNIRRSIALDRALHRARQSEIIKLTKESRFVIFSDHHKGGRDAADDFQKCESSYLTALDHYYDKDYSLIVLGDVEELWEESIPKVMEAYANVFTSEARFYPHRYIRFSGNHDNSWEVKGLVSQYLDPYFPGIAIRQELLLQFDDGLDTQGEILLLHGHQGTWDGDIFDFAPPYVLPYYRQFQNKTGFGHTSPSQSAYDRSIQDNQMYTWVSQQEKLVLIAGHTHRPIWGSMTHLETLMAQFHALLHTKPQPVDFGSRVIRLKEEIQERARKEPPKADAIKTKPCYFNTGCCRFGDGDITGIEIDHGDIRLIKWGNQNGKIGRFELEKIRLAEIFILL